MTLSFDLWPEVKAISFVWDDFSPDLSSLSELKSSAKLIKRRFEVNWFCMLSRQSLNAENQLNVMINNETSSAILSDH